MTGFVYTDINGERSHLSHSIGIMDTCAGTVRHDYITICHRGGQPLSIKGRYLPMYVTRKIISIILIVFNHLLEHITWHNRYRNIHYCSTPPTKCSGCLFLQLPPCFLSECNRKNTKVFDSSLLSRREVSLLQLSQVTSHERAWEGRGMAIGLWTVSEMGFFYGVSSVLLCT